MPRGRPTNRLSSDTMAIDVNSLAESVDFDQILSPENTKSFVWKYFGFPAKGGQFIEEDKKKRNFVICSLCKRPLPYQGNTTNMAVHLRHHHKELLDDSGNSPKLSSESPLPLKILFPAGESPLLTGEASLKQGVDLLQGAMPTTEGVLSKLPQALTAPEARLINPMPPSSAKWKKLSNSLCEFIAKDLLPIDLVNGQGFLGFMSSLEPRYVPPNATTIATRYFVQMYEQQRSKVMQKLASGFDYYSLAVEFWMDHLGFSYHGYTIHYINNDWKINSSFLGADCQVGKEEPNIILTKWNLPVEKLTAITVAAIESVLSKSLKCNHLVCLAFMFQFAIEQVMSIPGFDLTLKKAREVVKRWVHSDTPLNEDIPGQWVTTFKMLQAIMFQRELISPAHMPNEQDLAFMTAFITVTQPIAQIVEVLKSERWVTVAAVRLLIHKILSQYLVINPTDSNLVKEMKEVLKAHLTAEYSKCESSLLLNKACFLDPRFKSLSYLEEEEKQAVIKAIELEAMNMVPTDMQEKTAEPSAKKTKSDEIGIMTLIGDMVELSDNMDMPGDDFQMELQKYSSLEQIKDDPLEWWKYNETKFPVLSKLAKQYLAIPGLCEPPKRAFDSEDCGSFKNRRLWLHQEEMDIRLFLAENLK